MAAAALLRARPHSFEAGLSSIADAYWIDSEGLVQPSGRPMDNRRRDGKKIDRRERNAEEQALLSAQLLTAIATHHRKPQRANLWAMRGVGCVVAVVVTRGNGSARRTNARRRRGTWILAVADLPWGLELEDRVSQFSKFVALSKNGGGKRIRTSRMDGPGSPRPSLYRRGDLIAGGGAGGKRRQDVTLAPAGRGPAVNNLHW